MEPSKQIVTLSDYRTEDTLSLRARFVIEELRRATNRMDPKDVAGNIPGLDEAIAELGEACRAALMKETKCLPS